MDLLAFARGPALQWSLVVFVLGLVWRLAGIFLLRAKPDFSAPRNPDAWKGIRLVALRSWPRKEFIRGTIFSEAAGYTFHIGFLLALFFYLPHILFFKDILGFGWPHLPSGVIYFVGAITVATLLALLVHRLASPVKRLISNFDDYLSWFLTIAPVVTGMMAYAHVGGPYQTLLALHILSVEALMIWFPFGKLMHALLIVPSRATQGMQFERKGAAL